MRKTKPIVVEVLASFSAKKARTLSVAMRHENDENDGSNSLWGIYLTSSEQSYFSIGDTLTQPTRFINSSTSFDRVNNEK